MPQKTEKERIGILETRLGDHERRIRVQENKNDNLQEIATYVRLQVKHNEKQDKQLERITEVMNGIHINLAGLNKDVKEVKDDVGSVKGEVKHVSGRVDEIEEKRVKGLEGFKGSTVKFYLGIASAVLIAVILTWLNLK